jgi:hypothetical protein
MKAESRETTEKKAMLGTANILRKVLSTNLSTWEITPQALNCYNGIAAKLYTLETWFGSGM